MWLNKDIFDMFDSFELEPEEMERYNVSADRISRMTLRKISERKKNRRPSGKVLRIAFIAAVIACFMSVTAYAAFYFGIHYKYVDGSESYSYRYWTPSGYREGSYTVSDSYVLSFDVSPDGYQYVFRANWLPLEPNYTLSLYQNIEDMVCAELNMPFPAETEEEKARVAEGMEVLLDTLGMTAREAQSWYLIYDADEDGYGDPAKAPFYDIPYQIKLFNSSALYNMDYVIRDNFDDEKVVTDIVKDEVQGDWHTIWVHVDETGTDYAQRMPENPLLDTNLVLRFNQAEGVLLYVPGTLELETLDKIAQNVEILRTNIETHSSVDERDVSLMNLARG